jgi:hypothetical protein
MPYAIKRTHPNLPPRLCKDPHRPDKPLIFSDEEYPKAIRWAAMYRSEQTTGSDYEVEPYTPAEGEEVRHG